MTIAIVHCSGELSNTSQYQQLSQRHVCRTGPLNATTLTNSETDPIYTTELSDGMISNSATPCSNLLQSKSSLAVIIEHKKSDEAVSEIEVIKSKEKIDYLIEISNILIEGKLDRVKELIEEIINIDTNSKDVTVIATSAKQFTVTISMVLQLGIKDNVNKSFLHAIKYDMATMVKVFLEIGADINYDGYEENCSLSYASLKKKPASVKLLLDYGACVNGNKEKNNPLICAITKGLFYGVKLLLQRGASANYGKDEINNMNPLSFATHLKHDDIVQLLLFYGACANDRDGIVSNVLSSATHDCESTKIPRPITKRKQNIEIFDLRLNYAVLQSSEPRLIRFLRRFLRRFLCR